MDPLTISMIGGAASGLGGALGGLFGGGDKRKAREMLDKAYKLYGEITPASLEAVMAQEVGPSAMESLQVDPALKDAQLRALAQFARMQESGGLTLEDRAAMNDVLGDVARHESAGRAAIANDMEARGTLGSGAELAMRLNNQQQSTARANQQGMNTLASAQRRAYDAIMGQGQMAGQMRQQEFGEKSKAAEAKDYIARYNAEQRSRAQNQRNANANSQFNQRMALADAKAGLLKDKAGQYDKSAQATQQKWSGIGSAANQAAQTYGQYHQGLSSQGDGYEDDSYESRMRALQRSQDELSRRGIY